MATWRIWVGGNHIKNTTAMKKIILALVIALAIFTIVQCTKESHQPEQLPTPAELIVKAKLGEDVSVTIVNQVRQKLLDDLILADQQGQIKTANPGGQDTSGVNAVWQLTGEYVSPNAEVRNRIKIFTGSFQPDIYSMCFILEGSPNLRAQGGYVKFEEYSNYIDFPPYGTGYESVIYNAVANKFYMVFFSLTPFTLDWADKIVCTVGFRKLGSGQMWVSVNRSDPNNFALSSDGYTDYVTYFFPDTLYIN
jgi:hypothetical protein